MTVREVLDAAREAALEIRRIEDEAEIRREAVGPQGHSYDPHPKSGILDPMRHVDDLIEWEMAQINVAELQEPIAEAADIVRGIDRLGDHGATEIVTRYYLQGESWHEIVSAMESHTDYLKGLPRKTQIKCLKEAIGPSIDLWESIGIAKLKEMGR